MADKKITAQLRNVAKRYPDNYSSCRVSLGHSWQPLEAAWEKDGTIRQVLACSRCEALRVQKLDKRGYVLSRNYDYPDGYLMKGLGRLDVDARAIFRLAGVRRLLGK